MNLTFVIELTYLASATLFVVGLKRMQAPATARQGNALAALAMLLAIVATLVDQQVLDWAGIATGMVIGSVIGAVAARSVKMTAMPELVGLFNGFGGAASALVAAAEFVRLTQAGLAPDATTGVTIGLSMLIGAVTLSGSLIAFGKLNGTITGNPITFPGQKPVNALLFAVILGLGAGVAGLQLGTLDPMTAFLA